MEINETSSRGHLGKTCFVQEYVKKFTCHKKDAQNGNKQVDDLYRESMEMSGNVTFVGEMSGN